MKTKNLMIGVLTVAVIALSYMLYQAKQDIGGNSSNESENKSASKDSKEKFYHCDGKDTLISTDGSEVSWATVKPIIDSYAPNEDARAFHIGIENLNRIITNIGTYNSTASTANKIVGIRFYRAETTRTYIVAGNRTRTVTNTPDLIAVPSLSEKNLHEANVSANVPIYWHFRPCPKLCKKKNKKNKS